MIFNDNKIYAKVWKVTPSENGKYIDLQITTSEKDNDGNYVNSSWFPRVIGKAVNTLKGLKREDRIIILKSKFTNERRDTDDGKKSFFRFLILEAEIEGSDRASGNTPATDTKKKDKPTEEPAPAAAEDACPW